MKYLFLPIALFLLNCQSQKKETTSTTADSTQTVAATPTDSLSIDLVALKDQNLLGKVHIVEVKNDPVYHKKKRFNAVDFKEILYKYSSIKSLNTADTKLVFECEDGYKPEMPLDRLLESKVFLAVSDVDAPKGSDWEQIFQNGLEMKAAPFYLIYEGEAYQGIDYKRPYNLVKVHLAPLHENDEALVPKNNNAALAGYEIFKNRCQTCHSINKIGGKMGPELNYPKSVTEYWKTEDLQAFIVNPAAYRNEVKMPTLGIKPEESASIVKYLTYMSKHKL
ncbi:MAG: c-type cytochrome [Spirosomataceae bacterium]